MDRVAAMLVLLGLLVSMVLFLLALFAVAPIFCTCLLSLLYTLYLFLSNEASGVHHAQEFENRFWTVFAALLSTALFFAKDSPLAFGRWSPGLGLLGVLLSGFGMHTWDRIVHRKEISRQVGLRRGPSVVQSLVRLNALGIPVEDQVAQINSCLADIDQLLIPSTINNFINQRFILRKEREIITIFEEAQPKALNYLISHVKLGLIFYKIKDHRNFGGQHRTELIELLAVDRISVLTVLTRVIVLHALQMMKLPANARAEHWVRNIILSTHQDDLSDLKTITDAKGDYFCMNKLIYDDIRSETVRQDILAHIRKEAAVQQAHMSMGTKRAKLRMKKAWRKVLSDVDDTLTCSGGSYPAGIDRQYEKKVVYPGVIGFYRELDLGTQGPEEWPSNAVGNLVFLSARPHVYKDVSEKHNFAKFEKLRERDGIDGRGGLHTIPSLLAGDVASGREYMVTNNMEPLARKKFDNFKRYISIYPEYKHVFICDNGQGDVRAGEMTFDAFPQHLEALYVHVVQDITKTHGYDRARWREKGLEPCFFKTYPDAALNATRRKPPLIRASGLRRVCQDAVSDFKMIQAKQWTSPKQKWDRRDELNQAIWRCNQFLLQSAEDAVELIQADRRWIDGQKVRTPYGNGIVRSFDANFNMYGVELDWRPVDMQLAEHKENEARLKVQKSEATASRSRGASTSENTPPVLETVLETSEEVDDDNADMKQDDACQNGATKLVIAAGDTVKVLGSKLKQQQQETVDSLPKVVESVVSTDDDEFTRHNAPDERTAEEPPPPDPTPDNAIPDEGPHLVGEVSGAKSDEKLEPSPLRTGQSPIMVTAPLRPVIAKIQGRYISSFSSPPVPVLPKDDKRPMFSLWGTGGGGGRAKAKQFSKGDKVTTPFGPATIAEYRREEKIVVVDMIGWKARGFLTENCVKPDSKGLLGTLLRQISRGETSEPSSSPQKASRPKELEFLYVSGSTILTPFGEGVVTRPIVPPDEKTTVPKLSNVEKQKSDPPCSNAAKTPNSVTVKEPDSVATIAISLTSWTMSNECHPMLYCTPDTAREWKKNKYSSDGRRQTSKLLSSVFGSLVSGTVVSLRRMTGPSEKSMIQEVASLPRFERYYKDGAAVATQYGNGIVRSFRDLDGFYEVSLVKMMDGHSPTAYLQKDSLSYRLAKGCHEGYPVLTSLGLSGTLASVEPTTGIHIVTVPSAGAVCYLQPEDVLHPLKAAVGEDVLTPYGEGRVKRYRKHDDMYEIALSGWDGSLFARGETFDRVDDGMNDRGGAFGMSWILNFFFSREEKKSGDKQRSRSNSIASLSVRSQSGRSIT